MINGGNDHDNCSTLNLKTDLHHRDLVYVLKVNPVVPLRLMIGNLLVSTRDISVTSSVIVNVYAHSERFWVDRDLGEDGSKGQA